MFINNQFIIFRKRILHNFQYIHYFIILKYHKIERIREIYKYKKDWGYPPVAFPIIPYIRYSIRIHDKFNLRFYEKHAAGINRQRRVPSFESRPRGLILPSCVLPRPKKYYPTRQQGESAVLLIVDQIDPRRKSSGIDPGTRGRVGERVFRFSSVHPTSISTGIISARCRINAAIRSRGGSRKIRARDRLNLM